MKRNILPTEPELIKVYEEQDRLIKEHGIPKIGRWIYCKYCYKNVLPEINYWDGLIKCTECGSGLAPLDEVIKKGNYQKYNFGIKLKFARFIKYLDDIRDGIIKPTGKDEFGDVPYICDKCKAEEATVFSSRGHLCTECDDKLRRKS